MKHIFNFIKKQWLFVIIDLLLISMLVWTIANLINNYGTYYVVMSITILISLVFFGAITAQLAKEYNEQLKKQNKGKYIPKDKRRK